MGWIARNFGKFQVSKASNKNAAAKTNKGAKRTKGAKGARGAKDAAASRANLPYRAVTVYSKVECCAAAQRLAGQKFLAAHAPQLPLGGCTQPDTCRCRYRHLQDRRSEVRRDTDHGLPARSYAETERRNRRDRRRIRSTRNALAG